MGLMHSRAGKKHHKAEAKLLTDRRRAERRQRNARQWASLGTWIAGLLGGRRAHGPEDPPPPMP